MTASLLRAVVRRLFGAAAVLFGAASLAFLTIQLMPGDPVSVLLGPAATASPQVRRQIRTDYGFDRPVAVQYVRYLGRLVRGDFGESYQTQRPVTALIGGQLSPTVQLAAGALALAVALAVLTAVATAGRRPLLRSLASTWERVIVSTPTYWVGIVLLTFFSFRYRLFPVAGAENASALVLPVVTLALPLSGVLGQVLREGLEAVLGRPHVLTARARGLSSTRVLLRHALRHAAIPMVTLTGWMTGSLLGGAVLVETVFGRPGVGSLTLQAINNKDMPLVSGVVLLSAAVFVVLSLAVDLLYPVIDPRLHRG